MKFRTNYIFSNNNNNITLGELETSYMNTLVGNFKFNPVGHGLFYSGTLTHIKSQKKFSFVYDCGGKDRTIVNNAISTADLPQKIDLLIISHFHADHIKGVPLIKDRVKKVILPYLDNNLQILYLAALASNSSTEDFEELKGLILKPKEYFGNDVEVIQYEDSEDDQRLEVNYDEDGFSSNMNSGKLNKSSSEKIIWTFHFFMPKHATNASSMTSFFYNNSITTDNAKDHWDEIKKEMTRLQLNDNISNLVCAHGPTTALYLESIHSNILSPFYLNYNFRYCLYEYNFGFQFLTGDAEIDDEFAFVGIYKEELSKSLLFQIPHHGSKSNWHDWFSNYQPFCFLWPVTHNANHKFRSGTFPSATFTYIVPHSVTEIPKTTLGLQMHFLFK